MAAEILDPRGAFLYGREHGGQFGEVGLIDALLDRVGIANRWCFEVGAVDGRYYSNTLHLREQGWWAMLIEADEAKWRALHTRYTSPKVFCYHYKVDRYRLDSLLLEALLTIGGPPVELDLGVIDIDGQDYWAWEGMTRFRPRVMMVEYACGKLSAPVPPEGATTGQAGLSEIVALGKEKGYVALCRTEVNVLFVRADVLDPARRV